MRVSCSCVALGLALLACSKDAGPPPKASGAPGSDSGAAAEMGAAVASAEAGVAAGDTDAPRAKVTADADAIPSASRCAPAVIDPMVKRGPVRTKSLSKKGFIAFQLGSRRRELSLDGCRAVDAVRSSPWPLAEDPGATTTRHALVLSGPEPEPERTIVIGLPASESPPVAVGAVVGVRAAISSTGIHGITEGYILDNEGGLLAGRSEGEAITLPGFEVSLGRVLKTDPGGAPTRARAQVNAVNVIYQGAQFEVSDTRKVTLGARTYFVSGAGQSFTSGTRTRDSSSFAGLTVVRAP